MRCVARCVALCVALCFALRCALRSALPNIELCAALCFALCALRYVMFAFCVALHCNICTLQLFIVTQIEGFIIHCISWLLYTVLVLDEFEKRKLK